uniref:Phospholipid-transporting ATPase n=1 Tax=Petromyzon marinus TaxID=7757 RepID=A0AAJ7UDH1_PETMA|nr:probable phospholipid-transporting ATPase VD [Petromyzon marinus]
MQASETCRSVLSSISSRFSGDHRATSVEPRLDHHEHHHHHHQHRKVVPRNGTLDAEWERLTKRLPGNEIRTTKYTLLSFLPKNLFEQFHRFANVYFLFLVVLNWVPLVEAFQKEITMIPLVVVLGVIAVKDGLEDFRRYAMDRVVNNAGTAVYERCAGTFTERAWKSVRVGHLVRLRCNEAVPADVLLLASSDAAGICHLETATLDGESSLKQRHVARGLQTAGRPFDPRSFTSSVECESPTNDLERFRGFMIHASGRKVGLNKENLLLRGCTLRNTEEAVGMVIYAGHETKAMLNNNGPRYKRSKLEQRMNTDVMWCVLLLLAMCLLVACGHSVWLATYGDVRPPFDVPDRQGDHLPPPLAGFYMFWTMIIVLQVMIPISLYVSMEIVKLGQVYFIHRDVALYDERSDSRLQCRAFNITEDLGQVQHLFTDKTGTLTDNKMVFRRCAVAGTEYPHRENALRIATRHDSDSSDSEEAEERGDGGGADGTAPGAGQRVRRTRSSRLAPASSSSLTRHERSTHAAFSSPLEKEVTPDPRLLARVECGVAAVVSAAPAAAPEGAGAAAAPPPEGGDAAVDFFITLALCNTVLVSSRGGPPREAGVATEQRFSLRKIEVLLRKLKKREGGSSGADSAQGQSSTPPALAGEAAPEGGLDADRGNANAAPAAPERRSPTREAAAAERSGRAARPEQGGDETAATADSETAAARPGGGAARTAKSGEPRSADDDGDDGDDGGDDDATDLEYRAESPDEAALVYAARAYGFTLVARRPRSATLLLTRSPAGGDAETLAGGGVGGGGVGGGEVGGGGVGGVGGGGVGAGGGGCTLTFEVLHVLGFDSLRKRMSVVVRHPLTGAVALYAKGADSAILPTLRPLSRDSRLDKQQQKIREKTEFYLNSYARDGLRTLCIAKRALSEEAYAEWRSGHMEAEAAIESRELLLQQSALRIETELELLGATGVEDRLQEGVPDTVSALRAAGLHVWVLTGDKRETAVNVATACRLVWPGDVVCTVNATSTSGCAEQIERLLRNVPEATTADGGVSRTTAPVEASSDFHHYQQQGRRCCLVVEGPALALVMDDAALQGRFLAAASASAVVICCRATPLQKGQIVQLVRDRLHVRTLAIGDGANDVSMIQVADVGIGISGQEGMQAVMSSDFAIARFSHLRRLLLVHGHWCYTRLANMVLYFFYKNAAFVFLLFWYQFVCGFSGNSMMDQWQLVLFNLLFTSAPPLVAGLLDRDVPAAALLARPHLYRAGQDSAEYSPRLFWLTMLDAAYQSAVCFLLPYYAYADSDAGVFTWGTPITTIALFTILGHLAIETKTWTVFHWLVTLGSVLLYAGFSLACGALCVRCSPPANPLGIAQRTLLEPRAHLVAIITPVTALLPRFLYRALQGTVFPTPAQLARQQRPPGLAARLPDDSQRSTASETPLLAPDGPREAPSVELERSLSSSEVTVSGTADGRSSRNSII